MPPGSNGVSPSQNRRPQASMPPTSDVEVPYANGGIAQVNSNDYDGPVDLDELFTSSRNQIDKRDADEDSLFDDDDDEDDTEILGPQVKYFNNPHKRLLDNDASLIPGSPFSKPAMRRSNRPSEPLAMAKVRYYALMFGFMSLWFSHAILLIIYLFFLLFHSTHRLLRGSLRSDGSFI